jgi:hypothetical protein
VTAIVRVHYREQQRLLASDLSAEQDARLGAVGRHHLTHHQWGVVRGLWLTQDPGGVWSLSPGIAIDGYGREIIVPEAVEIGEPDNSDCWTILLYYCESPDGPCLGKPPSRMAGDYRIEIVPWDVAGPDEWLDLVRAKSAGAMFGLPPWPVLVGRVGYCFPRNDIANADLTRTRYGRVRGDLVTASSGRATLQIGLRDATDIHHFLLSTGSDRQSLERRVGFNRDGTLHVWKPLFLTGPEGKGVAPLSQAASIQLSTIMPAGIRRTLLVEGTLTPTKAGSVLSMALHDAAISRPIAGSTLLTTAAPQVPTAIAPGLLVNPVLLGAPKDLKPFLPRARTVRGSGGTAERTAAIPLPTQLTGKSVQFAMKVTPTGGHLYVGGTPEEAEKQAPPTETKPECGDISRSHSAPPPPPRGMTILEPATEPPLAETARGFYAIESKAVDLTPQTEFRLAGGAIEKSDAACRLSFGRVELTGSWNPMVSLDGAGRIAITPPLEVMEGTIYLPPVAALPTDALFQDLLVLAKLGGFAAVGRVVAGATLVPTTPVTDGSDLLYTVTLATSTLKRCIAMVRGKVGPRDVVIHSVAGGASPLSAKIPKFRHQASEVEMQVALLVEEGGQEKVALSDIKQVQVQHP